MFSISCLRAVGLMRCTVVHRGVRVVQTRSALLFKLHAESSVKSALVYIFVEVDVRSAHYMARFMCHKIGHTPRVVTKGLSLCHDQVLRTASFLLVGAPHFVPPPCDRWRLTSPPSGRCCSECSS